MPNPDFAKVDRETADAAAPARSRDVWDGAAWRETPVYERTALASGAMVDGPCVVEEAFTTLAIPNGWRARMTAAGDLVAERIAR